MKDVLKNVVDWQLPPVPTLTLPCPVCNTPVTGLRCSMCGTLMCQEPCDGEPPYARDMAERDGHN